MIDGLMVVPVVVISGVDMKVVVVEGVGGVA